MGVCFGPLPYHREDDFILILCAHGSILVHVIEFMPASSKWSYMHTCTDAKSRFLEIMPTYTGPSVAQQAIWTQQHLWVTREFVGRVANCETAPTFLQLCQLCEDFLDMVLYHNTPVKSAKKYAVAILHDCVRLHNKLMFGTVCAQRLLCLAVWIWNMCYDRNSTFFEVKDDYVFLDIVWRKICQLKSKLQDKTYPTTENQTTGQILDRLAELEWMAKHILRIISNTHDEGEEKRKLGWSASFK